MFDGRDKRLEIDTRGEKYFLCRVLIYTIQSAAGAMQGFGKVVDFSQSLPGNYSES